MTVTTSEPERCTGCGSGVWRRISDNEAIHLNTEKAQECPEVSWEARRRHKEGRGLHQYSLTHEWNHETHQRLMREWYGLRPSRALSHGQCRLGGALCPAWASGRRCRAQENPCLCPEPGCPGEVYPWMARAVHRPMCLCQELLSHGMDRRDHTYIWYGPDKTRAWSTEPYNASKLAYDEEGVQRALDRYGLRLTVTTERSPWFPGSTTLFLITQVAEASPTLEEEMPQYDTYRYGLAQRCPMCHAIPGTDCDAPRKRAKLAKYDSLRAKAGRPPVEHVAHATMHVARQNAGQTAYNRDLRAWTRKQGS